MTTIMRRSSDKPVQETRVAFAHFMSLNTRWMDNDVYGHVNNVVYYSWFDTVVNEFLVRNDALDFRGGETIGVVADTQCSFFSAISFPDRVTIGLKVAKLGTTSVRYRLGVFRDEERTASAQGSLVHVYVDRESRRPVAVPESLRRALEKLR